MRRTASAARRRDQDDTLELLTGLVDKSMVTVRGGGADPRYGVWRRCVRTAESVCGRTGLTRYARRHAAYFTELAERAAAGMHSPDEQAWVERMLPDYDNLRTAFEHAMADR